MVQLRVWTLREALNRNSYKKIKKTAYILLLIALVAGICHFLLTSCTLDRECIVMDNIYTNALVEMGTSLTALAVKGTASAVNTKIKAIKEEKNVERIRSTYDEIVNELISEREEAIRIAQVYKTELDRIEISDDDIKHLHNTVERLLELFKIMSPNAPIETFEQMKELISVDTLKAIQLLGFNYKAAIGEPLTQLCADAILSKSKSKGNLVPSKSKR